MIPINGDVLQIHTKREVSSTSRAKVSLPVFELSKSSFSFTMEVLMSFLQSPVKVIALSSVLSFVIYLGIRPFLRIGYPARLPPSPPAEPFLGHWRKLPLENAHLKYMEDAKKYSELEF